MVNLLSHVPKFLRQLLFDIIIKEVNGIDGTTVEADFQKARELILARLAALFEL